MRRNAWLLCWLLFAATALSFLDRQVLSVLAPAITREFAMNNTAYSHVVLAFQLAYTVMFSVGGRLLDRLGTRLGLALSLGIWSMASAAHALVTGAWGLAGARLFLGFGEGACFPAATKGATEWFPPQSRSLAIGLANGGSALGAVIAPPLTAWLAMQFGWRGAFLATGMLGGVWLCAWLVASRGAGRQAPGTAPVPTPWSRLRGDRRLWRILAARFLFDPVFYFYMFWIPQYLARERNLSVAAIGGYFWIPFLVLGVSQVLSGGVADRIARTGRRTPLQAKILLLTIAALATPVSWFIGLVPNVQSAIAIISLLLFAHGIWITNYLGVLGDLFPANSIATVTGLTGTAGGIGAMLSSAVTGPVIDHFSFAPLFVACGILYPLALLLLRPLASGGAQPAVTERATIQ
jgi:ACS family hexuronate transporter-like MFS transporter